MTNDELRQLIARTKADIAGREAEVKNLHLLFGFDAFIDQIAEMVDKRQDFEHFTRLETITAFGEKITAAAGLSTSMEYVPRYTKIGGSAVNMGAAMMSAGCSLTYIGCIGYPSVNPVFKDFAAQTARYYNIANPGQTIALEFNDGKIMLCNTSPLKEITWERICEVVGIERLREIMAQSQLVATINWTMIPQMNDIWQKMQEKVLPNLPVAEKKPLFFLDPIDPEKRDGADIVKAMEIFAGFSSHYRVILSINRKEAIEFAKAYGLTLSKPLPEADLQEITEAVAEKVGLYGLVVHPVDGAGAVIDGKYFTAIGPYTSKPVLTTGAGDNFNGGFCLGLLLGLEPVEALILGTATSGYYVRAAHSPSFQELVNFLDRWQENVSKDFP